MTHIPREGEKSPAEMNPAEQIAAALEIAKRNGTTDGALHKIWVLDQMVRVLTGCPEITDSSMSPTSGEYYTYSILGESAAYIEFVEEAGENGFSAWDTGIAP